MLNNKISLLGIWTENEKKDGYCSEASSLQHDNVPMPELHQFFPYDRAEKKRDADNDITHWVYKSPTNQKTYTVFND